MTSDEALLEWIAQPPTWSDLEWIRESFAGPIVVKGVLTTTMRDEPWIVVLQG